MTELIEPEEPEIPAWRKYEHRIVEVLQEMARDDAVVLFNQKVLGRFSGVLRQIDALVTADFGRTIAKEVQAVVDCKHYSKPVHVKHIEAFIGMVDDVGAELGILITNVGFTDAAVARAKDGGRGIRLKVIPVEAENPPTPYHESYDEAYYECEYFEVGYGNTADYTTITYHYVEDSDYPPAPDEEPLEWLSTPIDSTPDSELDWDTDAGRRRGARAVLDHYLGREPTHEEVELFVQEIASEWEAGYAWVAYDGFIRARTGLWREGPPEGRDPGV